MTRVTSVVLACADCGGDRMHAVYDGERTNFRCARCGACWHVELGFVSRVDPAHCPGCDAFPDCPGRAVA